jgi:hypothetical protein
MKFFSYFPKMSYEFHASNGAFTLDMTNITTRFVIMERLKQHVTVLHDYIVQDGERPDTVAQKVYGSPDHTWVVLLINNIMSLYDWPLTSFVFDRYIVSKYGSQAAAQANTLYKTSDGYYVDANTYSQLPVSERGSTPSAYDDELTKNEDKRRIKVIPQEFVQPVILELRKQV